MARRGGRPGPRARRGHRAVRGVALRLPRRARLPGHGERGPARRPPRALERALRDRPVRGPARGAAATGWFVHVFVGREDRRAVDDPARLRAALRAAAALDSIPAGPTTREVVRSCAGPSSRSSRWFRWPSPPRRWPSPSPTASTCRTAGSRRASPRARAARSTSGSIPTGAVRRINARTGASRTLVRARDGRAAIGLEAVGRRLFVAGGPTGKAFVYSTRTGGAVARLPARARGRRRHVRQRRRGDRRRRLLHRLAPLGPLRRAARPVRAARAAAARHPAARGATTSTASSPRPTARTLIAVQSNAGTLWQHRRRHGPRRARSTSAARP